MGDRYRDPGDGKTYGRAWVYESLVGALPGVRLTATQAILLQVVVFETGVLVLAWAYGLWGAVPAGTAAVAVAAVGSLAMLRMGEGIRSLSVPDPYPRLLFGSSVEVVLGVLAFVALVTHLFVFDPRQGGETIVAALFGPDPPVVVVYLALLVLWDLCYRIGTSWWAAVVALWRAWRYTFDPATVRRLRRLDLVNVGFAVAQAGLLPFVRNDPILFVAVGGHVLAVTVVSVGAALGTRVE